MGDSSCLLQDFTQASNGHREVNPAVAALRGSVSFGRFLSESLDWGKWSSFCQKSYLEEVEKYSVPGSVAQKKAFFEAHYKKTAARKLGNLLEQANASASNDTEGESGDRNSNSGDPIHSSDMKLECGSLSSEMASGEGVEVKTPKVDAGSSVNIDSSNPGDENSALETGKEGDIDPRAEIEPILVSSMWTESLNAAEDIENQNNVSRIVNSRSNPSEKQPLKESCATNQGIGDSIDRERRISNSKLSLAQRSSRLPPSPASKLPCSPVRTGSPLHCRKESNYTPRSSVKPGTGSNGQKRSSSKCLRASINPKEYQNGLITPTKTRSSIALEKRDAAKLVSNFRTPTRASSNVMPKLVPKAPQSKGQSIYSTSMKTKETKAHTLIASSSLSFRADDRAEKWKELSYNLEDKSDSKERRKLQRQQAAKDCQGKSENELTKLHQSLCFKARPLPHFYRNIGSAKNEMSKVDTHQETSTDSIDTVSIPQIQRKKQSNASQT